MVLSIDLDKNLEKKVLIEGNRLAIAPERLLEIVLADSFSRAGAYEDQIATQPDRSPRLAGTRISVALIATEGVHFGRSPEEIVAAHPDISFSQVHAALAYYYAHQGEIDSYIDETIKYVDAIQSSTGESPFQLRMRTSGRLP